MTHDLEHMAQTLEASDDYRVLRRMSLGGNFVSHKGGNIYKAIYLDLETTGLNPEVDEIIEIGMVPFTYGDAGQIYSVDMPFSKLREPSLPISAEVTKINNITNEMVAGQRIDPIEVFEFARHAGLIIAHNARFDRVFLEKLVPDFAEKPWACSMSEIAWKEEGFNGTRLSHIAADFGFFYEAHRAVEDCWAGIDVLSRTLPISGEGVMSKLLASARTSIKRVWAVSAPYDVKDILKARGYRWNDGNDGRPKAWYFDVSLEAYEAECAFLQTEIYQRDINLPVTVLTAKDRYSNRA